MDRQGIAGRMLKKIKLRQKHDRLGIHFKQQGLTASFLFSFSSPFSLHSLTIPVASAVFPRSLFP
jgi:hypothetical protein